MNKRRLLVRICSSTFFYILHSFTCYAALETGIEESLEYTCQYFLSEQISPVISVSKFPESSMTVPASVTVITQQDIKNSGAIMLTDLLRMVPGINVADISMTAKAVSSRGLAARHNNNLLVLIDGRTIYTPVFAGVDWDQQFPMLENIDHIEVIRGPGSTTWGANAVNGIINIITKTPSETDNFVISEKYGRNNTSFTGISGKINKNSFTASAYAQYQITNGFNEGIDDLMIKYGQDDIKRKNGEISLEWKKDTNTSIIFRTGASNVNDMENEITDRSIEEKYMIFDYVSSNLRIKTFYSNDNQANTRTGISNSGLWYSDSLTDTKTYDFTIDYKFNWTEKLTNIIGAGYRQVQWDEARTIAKNGNIDIWNFFMQNEWYFNDTDSVTIGAKAENHEYVDIQYSPRLGFQRKFENGVLRASWARAYRVPSILEHDYRYFIGVGYLLGNNDVESEKVDAYEIGYRTQIADDTIFDLTLYYHTYVDLISTNQSYTFNPTFLINFTIDNIYDGNIKGVELNLKHYICEKWVTNIGGTYSKTDIPQTLIQKTTDAQFSQKISSSPDWTIFLANNFNVARGLTCNINGYYSGKTNWPQQYRYSVLDHEVDSYFRLDAKISKAFDSGWEAVLVGQNLLSSHFEGVSTIGMSSKVSSFYYLGLSYKK